MAATVRDRQPRAVRHSAALCCYPGRHHGDVALWLTLSALCIQLAGRRNRQVRRCLRQLHGGDAAGDGNNAERCGGVRGIKGREKRCGTWSQGGHRCSAGDDGCGAVDVLRGGGSRCGARGGGHVAAGRRCLRKVCCGVLGGDGGILGVVAAAGCGSCRQLSTTCTTDNNTSMSAEETQTAMRGQRVRVRRTDVLVLQQHSRTDAPNIAMELTCATTQWN
jgi:hypothetical protein